MNNVNEKHMNKFLPVELVDHGGFPVASHHHLLLLQLFRHLDGRDERIVNKNPE